MHDLRSAWRALRQSPVLSAAAILSLALGMGANTALFSVVDALLLRDAARSSARSAGDGLVRIRARSRLQGRRRHELRHLDAHARAGPGTTSFDDGFAWAPVRVDLSDGGEMQPADALFASGGFFTTLGVPALLGRTFTPADDQQGGGPEGVVAVISYRVWQRRFNGAADVIGTALPVDGVRCTVIGVMPPDFFGIEVGQPFDVALPLAVEPIVRGARASLHHPSALMLTAMFRLAPGQSVDAATAALRAMQPDILGLSGASPRQVPAMLKDPYVLVPAASGTSDRSGLRRVYTRPLLTILAVVVLVLLVACVNIANLLMVRAAARRHEMSVRLALGSSRWQLARQLLAESLLLAGLGAAAGLVFAAVGESARGCQSLDARHAGHARPVARLASAGRDRGHGRADGGAVRHRSGVPRITRRTDRRVARSWPGRGVRRTFRKSRGAPGRVVAGAARRRRDRSSRPSGGWRRCRWGSTPTASSSSTSIRPAPTRTQPPVSRTTSSWSIPCARCPAWRRQPRRRSRRSIRRRSHRSSPIPPACTSRWSRRSSLPPTAR